MNITRNMLEIAVRKAIRNKDIQRSVLVANVAADLRRTWTSGEMTTAEILAEAIAIGYHLHEAEQNDSLEDEPSYKQFPEPRWDAE
jgi:hypothetical protein